MWKERTMPIMLGTCTRLVVKGRSPVGRPRKNWQFTLFADKSLLKVDPQDK